MKSGAALLAFVLVGCASAPRSTLAPSCAPASNGSLPASPVDDQSPAAILARTRNELAVAAHEVQRYLGAYERLPATLADVLVLPPPHPRLRLTSAILFDGWNRPLAFVVLPGADAFEVRSFGRDGIASTPDDIAESFPVCARPPSLAH